MTTPQSTVTYTLTGPKNLVNHVAHLQDVLTIRNATIDNLMEALRVAQATPPATPASLRAAYLRGYHAARGTFAPAATALREALTTLQHRTDPPTPYDEPVEDAPA